MASQFFHEVAQGLRETPREMWNSLMPPSNLAIIVILTAGTCGVVAVFVALMTWVCCSW